MYMYVSPLSVIRNGPLDEGSVIRGYTREHVHSRFHVHVYMQTLSLLGAIASSSSMKIIAGAFFSASSKAA